MAKYPHTKRKRARSFSPYPIKDDQRQSTVTTTIMRLRLKRNQRQGGASSGFWGILTGYQTAPHRWVCYGIAF